MISYLVIALPSKGQFPVLFKLVRKVKKFEKERIPFNCFFEAVVTEVVTAVIAGDWVVSDSLAAVTPHQFHVKLFLVDDLRGTEPANTHLT